MKRISLYIWPSLVLLGAIALLQLHSIRFWNSHVESAGWAWSILLEAVALWFWYQRTPIKRILGLVASVLTLLGPVYDVSEPIISSLVSAQYTNSGRESLIASLSEEQVRLEESIKTFRANSKERTGWLGPIQQSEKRLVEVGEKLSKLREKPPETEGEWRTKGIIIMQVAALILFQITAVLSITTLSRREADFQEKANISHPEEGGEIEWKQERKEPDTSGNDADKETQTAVIKEEIRESHVSPLAKPSAPTATMVSSSNVAAFPPTETVKHDQEQEPSPLPEREVSDLDKGPFTYQDIVALRDVLLSYLQKHAKTQSAFAREAGVSPRDIVFLKKHESLVEENRRTISVECLDRINRTVKKLLNS